MVRGINEQNNNNKIMKSNKYANINFDFYINDRNKNENLDAAAIAGQGGQ